MGSDSTNGQNVRRTYGRASRNLYARIITATGERMAAETTKESDTLEDLMMSTGAMADAAVKQLIGKGVLIDAEFKAKLDSEQTSYLAVLERLQ